MQKPETLARALMLYAIAFIAVVGIANAATTLIGLPDWVIPGAVTLMALGLPVILLTWYVQLVTRRTLIATPPRTPGGSTRSDGTLASLALKAAPHFSWGRAAGGGGVALTAFAVAIAVFMAMRAFGIGPAGSLFGAGTLKARDVIMVADFTVNGADSSIGAVVAEAVRANLSQSSSILLAQPTAILDAVQRMERPASTRIDLPVARAIATREGYKAIVIGDVTALGAGYVVSLRLVTADSGFVLATYQSVVKRPDDLVAGIDGIARQLRRKIGESLRSVAQSPPLERVTTASIPALRAYTFGAHAFGVDRDYPRAISFLRQSVAIDSNFGMAWRKLAVALNRGGHPRSAVSSALRRAFALAGRMTQQERLATEESYYNTVGFDRRRAIAAGEQLLALGDTSYVVNLAAHYWSRADLPRAESLYRIAARKYGRSNALAMESLVSVLNSEGDFTDADAYLDTIRQRFPTNVRPAQARLERLFRDGRYDALLAAVDTARRSASRELRRSALREAGRAAELRGRLGEAKRWLAESTTSDSLAGIVPRPGEREVSAVAMDAWYFGPSDALVRRVDSAISAMQLNQLAESDRPYIDFGIAYVRAGAVDKARAMLARLRGEVKDTAFLRFQEEVQVHRLLFEIALAQRDGFTAVKETRQSYQLPDGPSAMNITRLPLDVARGFDVAGQSDSALFYFEQYLRGPRVPRAANDVAVLAFAYRRLGELYEAKGDRAKAADYLTKFIELWKDADPELQPRVTEARRRLASLRATQPR